MTNEITNEIVRHQDRVIYFLVLATLSCFLGFSLRKKIFEISDSAAGLLAEPNELMVQITEPLKNTLNTLIAAHFIVLGLLFNSKVEKENLFGAMILAGIGFAIIVMSTVFLSKRLVRPVTEKAGITEAYPAAYVTVASFGGGNRGFVMLYLLLISPSFAHLIGSNSTLLINHYLAFDAGYYIFFIVFHFVFMQPKVFKISMDFKNFAKGDLLNLLHPSVILAAFFLSVVIRAAGFKPSIPEDLIPTLRASLGNVMFFLATVYMILIFPRKKTEYKINFVKHLGGALAVLLPRATALALMLALIYALRYAGTWPVPELFLEHILIIGCIFCLLPASSGISSLLHHKDISDLTFQSVTAWIVNTNAYFLIYLLAIALFVGIEILRRT